MYPFFLILAVAINYNEFVSSMRVLRTYRMSRFRCGRLQGKRHLSAGEAAGVRPPPTPLAGRQLAQQLQVCPLQENMFLHRVLIGVPMRMVWHDGSRPNLQIVHHHINLYPLSFPVSRGMSRIDKQRVHIWHFGADLPATACRQHTANGGAHGSDNRCASAKKGHPVP